MFKAPRLIVLPELAEWVLGGVSPLESTEIGCRQMGIQTSALCPLCPSPSDVPLRAGFQPIRLTTQEVAFLGSLNSPPPPREVGDFFSSHG